MSVNTQQQRTRPTKPNTARAGSPVLNTFLVPLLILLGSGLLLYPNAASWLASVNQSKIIDQYSAELADVEPSVSQQLQAAAEYNAALDSGVLLKAGENKPTGDGTSHDDSLDYNSMLSSNEAGIMGRVRIPNIDVDLPIYHGTSDEVLLKGAGHLEGSHLPVGGEGTHSVITAHRGLAEATMFDDLGEVEIGDRFTLEIFGEVLTYQVRESRVVQPHETDTLRPVIGKDLVTLVTCTPLGINTHRMLITGERVEPTPLEDLSQAGTSPNVPGFPWWAVGAGVSLLLAGGYGWYSHRNTPNRLSTKGMK